MRHWIQLESYSDISISLPPQTQSFVPSAQTTVGFPRNSVVASCTHKIQEVIKIAEQNHGRLLERMLLILPDKTRSQIAARILLDAVMTLHQQHSYFTVTILYGLGTHPLMSDEEIRHLTGEERYQKLQQMGTMIKQQTTKTKTNDLVAVSIPSHPFQQSNFPQDYTVTVPQLLFNHDFTIIAGDTKLHPYEGRYGSGGINKMLAVGIASLNEIHRSHSAEVLLSPHTRVGDAKSPFVRMIDTTAGAIRQAMRDRADSRPLSIPYGLTVVAEDENHIGAFAFGNQEKDRRSLAEMNFRRHHFWVQTAFDVVVSDVLPRQGTDLLAGARSLQYLCDWNQQKTPLLHSPYCIALLYNPCHELQNNNGIGNDGTKEQLDVLATLTQESYQTLKPKIRQATTWQKLNQLLTEARRLILEQWQLHLEMVSQPELIWLGLEDLAQKALEQQQTSLPTASNAFYQALLKYRGQHNPTMRAIANLCDQYEQGQPLSRILAQIRVEIVNQEEEEGLGEGGQRAFRLLKICQNFQHFLIATANSTAISYLEALDPNLIPELSPQLREQCHFHQPSFASSVVSGQSRNHQTSQQTLSADQTLLCDQFRLSLLGLQAVDLNHYSSQVAVDLALAYASWYQPETPQLEVAFLQSPVILQRQILSEYNL
ncbi:MAG: lactate racemase domain-containing protein [Halothece sp. Uz-M2-17]|nr:lactate racemase domain-containing protein [Halothece sp. Uz-M2-17]